MSCYLKLVEYRNKLTSLPGDDIEENPEEYVKAEEQDRRILWTCEILYEAIPLDHALKTGPTPLHIEQPIGREVGAGDGAQGSHNSQNKKPNVPDFDGRNSSWVWWKVIVEREVESSTDL